MKPRPLLLRPLNLRGVRLANRAWAAPVLQYSARYGDGMPTDWHLAHYGSFAQGGFGLIITEPTAVNPAARVTLADVGLWSDLQVEPWKHIIDFIHSVRVPIDDKGRGPVRICLQLSHAGRKGSAASPLMSSGNALGVASEVPWQTVAPTAIAFPGLPVPEVLTRSGINRVVTDFSSAARRAERAGFDCLEINAADGYLVHQFLSPLTNKRSDSYGGVYSNRVRLLREIITAVRISWHGPLLVRIPGSDLAIGGWTSSDAVSLAVLMRMDGADMVDIAAGGNTLAERPDASGYTLPFATQVRQFSGIPIAAGGAISDPIEAERALANG
ncbi:MAG: NADH:flavin oxidoreductase/NADH oxidase, partial [Propionibacteriaceae bacterium]|nr:NADH:flavin oxidoreductase/NADH oxidase [Propionibacteriaceae bacterium]